MKRIRLTERQAAARSRKADAAEPATSIDLGKNRTYRKIDEYHNFEPSENHWTPDMRHEWKDNPREETGHGIPKMAKVYLAAKKATKLAMMLLGEDASEVMLEKQARSFMRMGDRALTASINRWAECKDCDKEVETADDSCEDCNKTADDEEVVEVVDEAPAEEAPVEPAEPVVEPEVVKDGVVTVDDEPVDAEIDFDDDDVDADVSADKALEACFEASDDESEEDAPVAGKPASKKAGLKKLAGQPTLTRVASRKADDLAGLWDSWSNPDIR